MKVVITGKSGLLSSYLSELHPTLIQLSSDEYDITQPDIVKKLRWINPDIVIHAGAVTDAKQVVKNPIQAIQTNIVGTCNVSEYCIKYNKRLVYISTDYVYPGDGEGNHLEDSPVLPHNRYAWTKLGGECAVKLVTNHLIIRTSFGPDNFPYPQAYTTQTVSKDYVDIIAPKILKAALSTIVGTLNIGTESKTLFEYAIRRNNVEPLALPSNKNFSLNTDKYNESFSD